MNENEFLVGSMCVLNVTSNRAIVKNGQFDILYFFVLNSENVTASAVYV